MNQPSNHNKRSAEDKAAISPTTLAWLGCVLILAAFAALMAMGNSAPPSPASLDRLPATVAWQPSATSTATAYIATVRLATPVPPPTANPDNLSPNAATTATPEPPAAIGQTAPNSAAIATATAVATPAPPLANPQALVIAAAIPIAGSYPGSWQASGDGSTTYQLPEGAEEGEALGQLASGGASITIQIASIGEDCGVAWGNPQDFVLLRLRPAGQSELDVLLDRWQGDNYTTPPPASSLIIKSTALWHTLTVNWSTDQITYTIDGQSGRAAGSWATPNSGPPPGANAYLYAGGGGCQYRPVQLAMQAVSQTQRKRGFKVKAWSWFETKMYGRPLRKMRRGERLKLLIISAALGVALGVTLYATGLGQNFLAAGLQQAGFDPRPLYQNAAGTAPTATTWNAATAPTPPSRRGGGWVTPIAP